MSRVTIKYESKNGYMGLLYGDSSLSVFDSDGKEVFHTGYRGIDTYEKLVGFVERFPDFIATFNELDNFIAQHIDEDDEEV